MTAPVVALMLNRAASAPEIDRSGASGIRVRRGRGIDGSRAILGKVCRRGRGDRGGFVDVGDGDGDGLGG